jgi:succinyl-CoA synthetase alpha subunit
MLDALLSGARLPLLVQGATGRAAQRHLRLMRRYGTEIVAGVSLTAKLQEIDGVPIFTSCQEAVERTGAIASVVMVPPLSVLPAIEEALDAGVRLVVSVTEGMPVHDALRALRRVRAAGAVWIGPSTPGLAVPGRLKLGFLPDVALAPGPLAVLSKSGTLSYELCRRLVRRGVGQSVWIGVGGDPVKGARFAELVPALRDHDGTRGLLILGEIGGTEEEELAEALRRERFDKQVFAVLAGSSAPEGVTMGHAGALIHGGKGTLDSKTEALRGAGAEVFTRMEDAVENVAVRLAGERHDHLS